MLPNLSITAGLRYDYHGGLTEKYGNMFNFDPIGLQRDWQYDQWLHREQCRLCGGGQQQIRPDSRACSDSTLTGRQWGISPRVGFAWAPKKDTATLSSAAAAGMYYDRGELFSYLSQPAGSGNGGPFGVTESAPLASYVVGNGNALANPLGTALTPPDGLYRPQL